MNSQPAQIPANLPNGLVEGYRAFVEGRFIIEEHRFRDLAARGQKPPVLLIGCSDSRVSPEVIFDAGPGEIFVIRNIANLIPPFESPMAVEAAAAIEYAVVALAVAHIVIMGHAQCGGIRAFAQGQVNQFKPLTPDDFISKWKTLIEPAAERLGPPDDDFARHCESLCHASIVQGIANLRTYPWVTSCEGADRLTLHGAYFDVTNGQMSALDQARGVFVPVASQ